MDEDNYALNEHKSTGKLMLLAMFVVLMCIFVIFLFEKSRSSNSAFGPVGNIVDGSSEKLEFFTSDEEFKAYVTRSQEMSDDLGFGLTNVSRQFVALDSVSESNLSPGVPLTGGFAPLPTQKVVQTNVQVVGIDEPDILKTDGNSIYYSGSFGGYSAPVAIQEPFNLLLSDRIEVVRPVTQNTKVISARPTNPSQVSTIGTVGDMLLTNGILISFSGNTIQAFDVTSPEKPTKIWQNQIESRNTIVTSRLYSNTLYLVTKRYVNVDDPCPVPLFSTDSFIPCTRIYHPSSDVYVDSTMTISKIDPITGSVQDDVSFVTSSSNSVVYMSAGNIYITYSRNDGLFDFMAGLLVYVLEDKLTPEQINRINNLKSYDLSENTKIIELQNIVSNYLYSREGLDSDKYEQRAEQYAKDNVRKLTRTSIVKVRNDDLLLVAIGEVPGTPLNQFSLDEYLGNLRIATNINSSGYFGNYSVNDLYTLNPKMQVVGTLTDLGKTERIYSVRFVGDVGYIVTFRQIDPFYVVDLTDPKAPKLTGELKIPGFSSYLHQLSSDLVLGVGRENSKVKLSLFDVSNLNDPIEADQQVLDDFWTQIENNHHAFLADTESKVFFVPAGQNGYVYSYSEGFLDFRVKISGLQADRATVIGDYMYIFGREGLKVINEKDFNVVGSLDF